MRHTRLATSRGDSDVIGHAAGQRRQSKLDTLYKSNLFRQIPSRGFAVELLIVEGLAT